MRRTIFFLLLSLLALSCGQDVPPGIEISGPHGSAQGREYTDGQRMSLIEHLMKPGSEVSRQWVFQRFPGQEYLLTYATHEPAQVWFWWGPELRAAVDQALDEFGVQGSGCLGDTLRISRLEILPSLCDQYYACMYWGAHTGPVVNLCFDLQGHSYWLQNPKARTCVDALATIKVMIVGG